MSLRVTMTYEALVKSGAEGDLLESCLKEALKEYHSQGGTEDFELAELEAVHLMDPAGHAKMVAMGYHPTVEQAPAMALGAQAGPSPPEGGGTQPRGQRIPCADLDLMTRNLREEALPERRKRKKPEGKSNLLLLHSRFNVL